MELYFFDQAGNGRLKPVVVGMSGQLVADRSEDFVTPQRDDAQIIGSLSFAKFTKTLEESNRVECIDQYHWKSS